MDQERLDRAISFDDSNLVTYSPGTKPHAGGEGMTRSELCRAMMGVSDNTAANLVLEAIGGPEAVTDFVRSIGDQRTRLDRWEEDLNEVRPGDPRDTTTPNPMAATLETLVLGDALSPTSREQLIDWLKENRVSDALFRSVAPSGWIVADRTGAGGYGSRSITAVMWPLEREPIVAAVYVTETNASFDVRNAAIAEIGANIIREVVTEP